MSTTPIAPSFEAINAAAAAILKAVDGRALPRSEKELALVALAAGLPLHTAQIRQKTLASAAEDFGAGEWLDAFTQGRVEDDVTAVQATCKWLQERLAEPAEESAAVLPEAAVLTMMASIEDLVFAATGTHVFRDGRDGTFTPQADALAQIIMRK